MKFRWVPSSKKKDSIGNRSALDDVRRQRTKLGSSAPLTHTVSTPGFPDELNRHPGGNGLPSFIVPTMSVPRRCMMRLPCQTSLTARAVGFRYSDVDTGEDLGNSAVFMRGFDMSSGAETFYYSNGTYDKQDSWEGDAGSMFPPVDIRMPL